MKNNDVVLGKLDYDIDVDLEVMSKKKVGVLKFPLQFKVQEIIAVKEVWFGLSGISRKVLFIAGRKLIFHDIVSADLAEFVCGHWSKRKKAPNELKTSCTRIPHSKAGF